MVQYHYNNPDIIFAKIVLKMTGYRYNICRKVTERARKQERGEREFWWGEGGGWYFFSNIGWVCGFVVVQDRPLAKLNEIIYGNMQFRSSFNGLWLGLLTFGHVSL